MTALLLAVAAVVGYLVGRARPARRVSDWAGWQSRPTGLRLAAVWTINSADNLGWLITHPAKALLIWRIRRSPAARGETPVRADPWPPEDPR